MEQLNASQILALSGGKAHDLADQMNEAQETLRKIGAAMHGLQQQSVRGESPDGLVSAEVTGMSRLVAVHVSARAMRDLDHVEIGKAAVEAIGAARAAAATQLMAAFQDVTGEVPPARETIEIPIDIAQQIRRATQGN
ncbi:MAG TPA: YbaB/EbfC family nucleoid-associated protein [Actinoallomurus sp.]|jgi:DNA-binding protein YbaB